MSPGVAKICKFVLVEFSKEVTNFLAFEQHCRATF